MFQSSLGKHLWRFRIFDSINILTEQRRTKVYLEAVTLPRRCSRSFPRSQRLTSPIFSINIPFLASCYMRYRKHLHRSLSITRQPCMDHKAIGKFVAQRTMELNKTDNTYLFANSLDFITPISVCRTAHLREKTLTARLTQGCTGS